MVLIFLYKERYRKFNPNFFKNSSHKSHEIFGVVYTHQKLSDFEGQMY